MTAETSPEQPWSPADNPQAVAVSEAQWWMWTLRLCLRRVAQPDVEIWPPDSRQIDARLFLIALRQVDYAADMLLKHAPLRTVPAAWAALERARQDFRQAHPGIVGARDILIHFGDYAQGNGKRQARQREREGAAAAARDHWGGGYDPASGDFTLGSHRTNLRVAAEGARLLSDAIYAAARAVDAAQAGDAT